MKKKYLFLLLGLLVLLLGLIVFLCISFFGLYNSSRSEASTSTEQLPDHRVEQFLVEKWHFDNAVYLEEENTLTGYRSFDLSYEQAQKIGANVFTGDLAPESYLPQALTIAADIGAQFSMQNLKVSIVFLSSDGQELFYASSDGNTGACWITEE